jgi:hypothetical protein
MSEPDFITGLEIEHDERLSARRTEGAGIAEALRRGAVGVPADDIADERFRAAVNGGSVISFVAGLDAGEMSDVLFSTQLAQRAASAQHDRQKEVEAWYRVYGEVLERVGWTGEAFAFTQRSSTSGEFKMDRSALDVIATIATGNQLAVLVKAIDAMRALGEGSDPIRLFELKALAEQSGNFQIGAVQRAENGALALALGAFHFRSSDNQGRALFWKWGAEQIEFWTSAQKLTLNREHYARQREEIMAKLGAQAADYLASLPLE